MDQGTILIALEITEIILAFVFVSLGISLSFKHKQYKSTK
ncbi:hypothetical protein SJAV_11110 [Sulfurisphaera javensis]|uniref:Uncharacterized protein n=1 Tax=Sulfurisphaera javensis TaxID=2049879 RepID=A0AAT9GQJ1_9CREN